MRIYQPLRIYWSYGVAHSNYHEFLLGVQFMYNSGFRRKEIPDKVQPRGVISSQHWAVLSFLRALDTIIVQI